MAKISCPNCGAIGNEGSVCEFCGTTITVKIKRNITITKEKNNSEKADIEEIIVGNNIISKEKAKEIALEWLEYDLNAAAYSITYEEYLCPIKEKIKLFDIEVEYFQIPLFTYTGYAKHSSSLNKELYFFVAYAGKDNEIPKQLLSVLKFSELHKYKIDDDFVKEAFVSSLKGKCAESKDLKRLFVKNKEKVWDSLKARGVKSSYSDFDTPIIGHHVLPLYLVNFKIDGELSEYTLIDGEGNIYREPNHIILGDSVLKHYLGDDFQDILDKKSEEVIKKREEEKQRQYEDKVKKFKAEAEKKGNAGATFFWIGIISMLGSLIFVSTSITALVVVFVLGLVFFIIGFCLICNA